MAVIENAKPKLIVILGPTASGKSALAVELARRLNGAVISADSRQVYRNLDIGTDKTAKKEMRGVPHFLLDVAGPKRPYTAARYAKDAVRAVRGVLARGNVPIVCGGTGFYIDALLYGTPFPAVPPNPAFRRMMEQRSTEALFFELKKHDPDRAASIDPQNRHRLIRALEIVAETGAPVRPLVKTPRYAALKIGVAIPRAILAQNIRARLTRDLRRGLIGEVRRLRRGGLSWKRLDELGLEYALVARYLRGEIKDERELEELLGSAVIRYAKRQLTWFKRDTEIHWIRSPREALALARRFLTT